MNRHDLIPAPTSITDTGDEVLVVTAATRVSGPSPVADLLVDTFARHTGIHLRRGGGDGAFAIRLNSDAADLAEEAYRLRVSPEGVDLEASSGAGLVRGIQTLVQLAEAGAGAVTIPAVIVEDAPRFAWRGVMLDIARHFFGVDDIVRVIDSAVFYKLNVLHLHLTDDQGWRLQIASRPKLTEISGGTQVGAGDGGFLTRADYEDVLAYAAARHVTVVPEIDLPGHTNAALLAYPELAPNGVEVEPYRGTEVGFSSLDAHNDESYALVDDVLRELAEIQPGGYVHIGGDEAHSTSTEDYVTFVERTLAIARRHGLRPVGWQEIVKADLPAELLVQYWDNRRPEDAAKAVAAGAKLIVSPASRVYLDMKYDADHPLGLEWAGHVDVRDAYDWDPADVADDAAVAGVEAPLWTETILTIEDIERMLFPRLPGVAERAWSAAPSRDWTDFRTRLAAHEDVWRRSGTGYHRSAQIDWS